MCECYVKLVAAAVGRRRRHETETGVQEGDPEPEQRPATENQRPERRISTPWVDIRATLLKSVHKEAFANRQSFTGSGTGGT